MNILRTLYETFLEALFPRSTSETRLDSYTPAEAVAVFKRASPYSGLAVTLPEARSLFMYNDPLVKTCIWNIKYKRSRHSVEIAGYALFSYIVNTYSATSHPVQPLLIAPLPITSTRRRERGYNQCELLTAEIKRLYEREPTPAVQLQFDDTLLIRAHHTSRSTLKNRVDRIRSSQGIFYIHTTAVSYDCSTPILVIDDVITTGSTMREAVDTLTHAGFTNVHALSIAH